MLFRSSRRTTQYTYSMQSMSDNTYDVTDGKHKPSPLTQGGEAHLTAHAETVATAPAYAPQSVQQPRAEASGKVLVDRDFFLRLQEMSQHCAAILKRMDEGRDLASTPASEGDPCHLLHMYVLLTTCFRLDYMMYVLCTSN